MAPLELPYPQFHLDPSVWVCSPFQPATPVIASNVGFSLLAFESQAESHRQTGNGICQSCPLTTAFARDFLARPILLSISFVKLSFSGPGMLFEPVS